jgi:hypothetical protein
MFYGRLYLIEPGVLRTQFVAYVATTRDFVFKKTRVIYTLAMASGESIEEVIRVCAKSHVNEFGPSRIHRRGLEFLTRMYFRRDDLPENLRTGVPEVFSTLDEYQFPSEAVQEWQRLVVKSVWIDDRQVELDKEALHFEYKGVGFTFFSPFAFSLLNSATRKAGA